jgi:hypothetical protein
VHGQAEQHACGRAGNLDARAGLQTATTNRQAGAPAVEWRRAGTHSYGGTLSRREAVSVGAAVGRRALNVRTLGKAAYA